MFDLHGKKFRVTGKKLLILRDQMKKEMGGIVLPDRVDDQQIAHQMFGWCGDVLQIGAQVHGFEVGDRIVFQKEYTVLPFTNRRLMITDYDTIIAKLEDAGDYERVKVMNDFLLVKPEEGVKVVGGTIKLPWERAAGAFGGEVLRCGEKCGNVSEGSRIFYIHGGAIKCAENGELRHIIPEENVLCQISKTKQ